MSKGQRIGYVRVSSVDQNSARQLDGTELDRVFEDKVSGKDTDRPALQQLMAFVRDGDTVLVHSIDRLARNLVDLRNLITVLNEKGVGVHFIKENVRFDPKAANDPMSMLTLNLMGAFAEFERALIRERQREGIAAAKAAGRPTGRPPSLSPEQVAEVQRRAAEGESKAALAKEFDVTRATIYAAIGKATEAA